MTNSTAGPSDFAETVPMSLGELPGPPVRFAAPRVPDKAIAAAVAAPLVAVPTTVTASAKATVPVAAPRPGAPLRRATDTGTGMNPRFSLHRRRSTDPTRGLAVAVAAPATAPSPSPARPTASEPTTPPALQLFVRGFNEVERRLLEGTVRLSQRRLPRLALVPEVNAIEADLVMIDGSDAEAVAWADSRPWLAGKNTIWIDSRLPRPGHVESQRPVQWPQLPMLLARALEQGRGATPPSLNPAPVRAATAEQAGRHVLVVDDSLAVRNHLRSLLETRGLRVTEAVCVSDALGAVASQHFDCVLMDVLMPDMDGYEGCKRIRSLKATIGVLPVLMLTSKSSPFDRIRGKMAGCDAYLTKPVQPALLYAALAPYLGLDNDVPATRARPAPPAYAAAERSAQR